MVGADDWPIHAPDGQCAECREGIPVETAFFSAVFHQDERFRRVDYCGRCFGSRPPPGEEVFAVWRTRRVAESAERPRVRFDPERVFQFFRKIDQAATGEALKLRFVLSLLLLRKKLLKYRATDGSAEGEILVLASRGGEVFRVLNPGLDDRELGSVRETIGQLLDLEVGGAPGEASPGRPEGEGSPAASEPAEAS